MIIRRQRKHRETGSYEDNPEDGGAVALSRSRGVGRPDSEDTLNSSGSLLVNCMLGVEEC